MPWCPECKAEYKDGIIECPDCKIPLVESLQDIGNSKMEELLTFDDPKLAEKFLEYLIYSEIPADSKMDDNTQAVTIYVDSKNLKKAKKHFNAFYSVEARKALTRDMADMKEANEILPENYKVSSECSVRLTEEEEVEKDEHSSESMEQVLEDALDEVVSAGTPYEKKSAKANDLLSTTLAFLGFSILLVIFICLNLFKVITIFSGLLFYIVGCLVFIAFFIVALQSYRSYKIVKKEAGQEEELTNIINQWLEQVFTEETKNEMCQIISQNFPELTEELMYLRLNIEMKRKITEQFGDIDDAYLDYIVEEFYNSHFS